MSSVAVSNCFYYLRFYNKPQCWYEYLLIQYYDIEYSDDTWCNKLYWWTVEIRYLQWVVVNKLLEDIWTFMYGAN